MRLLACHIENFGTLQACDLAFAEGLTVIFDANGRGKSTLAGFLRAMLYGFPRATRELARDPRRRFKPWQGGAYGGTLDFEHDGVRYRVARTFGSVPREDVYVLNELDPVTGAPVPCDRWGDQLGDELLGLDAASFERTCLLAQGPRLGSLSSGSIQAKLADLVDDTNDITSYDAAVSRLRSARSQLVPFSNTGRGAVAEATHAISELEDRISALEERRSELAVLEGRIEALRSTQQEGQQLVDDLRERREDALRAEAATQARAHLEDLQAEVAAHEERLAALGVDPDAPAVPEEAQPTREELDELAEAVATRDALLGEMGANDLETLALLEARFGDGVPTEGRFACSC